MWCRRLWLIENYNELCLWFQYAIECSLFFQVWQKLLLNENTVTDKVAVYTGVGDRPSIPKVMTSGEILQDGKIWQLYCCLCLPKWGEIPKFNSEPRRKFKAKNLLKYTIINFLMIHNSNWPDLLSFSVYPHLHCFISSALVFPDLLEFSMICLFN